MQNLFPFTQRKKRACSLLKMTRASLGPAYPVSVYLQALPGQDGSSMQLSGAWWEVVAEFELAGFVQEHLRIPWDVCSSSTSSCPVQISQHKQILLPGWRRRGDDSCFPPKDVFVGRAKSPSWVQCHEMRYTTPVLVSSEVGGAGRLKVSLGFRVGSIWFLKCTL